MTVREREREREKQDGVLGEDMHLWGSQVLNNSDRDLQYSVQRRSTVRSAHSLQRRGRTKRERGTVYKDSMTEEDITVCACTGNLCVGTVCIYA